MKYICRLLSVLFFMLPVGAFLPVSSAKAAEPLSVVVSILPQKYLVERIGGEAVKVVALVGPGAEPHTYEPTPSQMKEAARANIYFSMGVPFEDAWVARITGSADNLKVISIIEGITRISGDCDREDHHHEDCTPGGEDPHTWLSPLLVRQMAALLTRELSAALPENAEVFKANAAALDKEIEELDKTIASKFQNIAPERRYFLTFHPTWGYYAKQYGLTELSIEVDGKEPSAKAMANIIKTAREYGLSAIFVEPQFSQSAARAIAENIGAKIVEVNPLEENWFELMNTFTDALVAAFAANAPGPTKK